MSTRGPEVRVFVSYSRDDASFADQLVLALGDRGFDPRIDRQDIDAGEAWKRRLDKLILSADAIVFVLTDASAASETCAWEVRRAAQLGKRIVPVLPKPLNVAASDELAELNYIHFYEEPMVAGAGFYQGLIDLERALKIDVTWLREQTRLSELAADWDARGRKEDLLLRGVALDDALDFIAAAPPGAVVPDILRAFINASEDAARRRRALAKAQVEERERAIADREEAVSRASKLGARLRRVTFWAACAAGVLVIFGVVSNISATKGALDANDLRADLFAGESYALSDEGRHAEGLLMALLGDPAAKRLSIARVLRAEGNASVLDAMTTAYTGNRLLSRSLLNDTPGLGVVLPDGERFLTISRDGQPTLRRVGAASPIMVYEGGDRRIRELALSRDGGRFAAYSRGLIKIWSVDEPSPLVTMKYRQRPLGGFVEVALSSDGQRVYAASRRQVFTGDVDVGVVSLAFTLDDEQFRSFGGIRGFDAATTDDGDRLAVFGARNRVYLFDDGLNSSPREFTPIRRATINLMKLGPRGELLAIGHSRSRVSIWNLEGKQAKEFDSFATEGTTTALAFSQSGEFAVAADRTGAVRLRSLIDRGRVQVLRGHRKRVESIVLSEIDGELRVTMLAPDEMATNATFAEPSPLHLLRPKRENAIFGWRAAAISDRGDALMVGARYVRRLEPVEGRGPTTNYQDAGETLQVIRPRREPQYDKLELPTQIRDLTFLPGGEEFLSVDFDGVVHRWALGEPEPAKKLFEGEQIWSIGVSARGDSVAMLGSDGVNFIDLRDGALLGAIPNQENVVFGGLRMSPDGAFLATSNRAASRTMYVISSKARELISTIDLGDEPRAIALSPIIDGRLILATVLRSNELQYWSISVDSGAASLFRMVTLPADARTIDILEFSPDGEYLAALSSADSIRIWSMRAGRPLQKIKPDPGYALQMRFVRRELDATGYDLVVLSNDGVFERFALDPYLAMDPSQKIAAACELLLATKVSTFTDEDRGRYALLSKLPSLAPCG